MKQLPYDVSSWVSTEAFAGELAKSFDDFQGQPHNVVHLVDILGRLIPLTLAEAVVKCRKRTTELLVVRSLVRQHLGLSDQGPASERVQWACILLVGDY